MSGGDINSWFLKRGWPNGLHGQLQHRRAQRGQGNRWGGQ